jgi:hypothetical protein
MQPISLIESGWASQPLPCCVRFQRMRKSCSGMTTSHAAGSFLLDQSQQYALRRLRDLEFDAHAGILRNARIAEDQVWMEGGIGSSCSARLSGYPAMASWMLSIASCRVSPRARPV